MEVNFKLKLALQKKYGSQIAASYELGINESTLSKIVHRWMTPTPEQQTLLSKALDEPAENLFQHQGE